MARKVLREEKYRHQYRSNLSKIIKFLEGIDFKKSHMDRLRETPFYTFLAPFINKQVESRYVKGVQHGLVEILMYYNRKCDAFDVGGHMLAMSPREFELIFGITLGDKEIDMISCPVHEIVDALVTWSKGMPYYVDQLRKKRSRNH